MSWFSNIQSALLGNNTTFRSIFFSEAKLISGVEWILPLNLTNRPWSAPIQHSSFQVLSLLEYDQFGLFGSVIPHNSCKETAQIAQHKPFGIKFKLEWQHMKSPSCLWKSQRAENCSTHFNYYAKPYFRPSTSEAMATELYQCVGRCLLRNGNYRLPPPLPSFLLSHSTGYTLKASVEQQAK